MKFIVVFLDLAKGIGSYPAGKIKFSPLEISLMFWPLGASASERDGWLWQPKAPFSFRPDSQLPGAFRKEFSQKTCT